ncbi:unnamed protein product [Ceratitis capitata]|uniref:Signal recognition particle receptor subunit beta n=1 Tax=Ceratitis capitata TaxID=7213 RepID=A0A811UWS5_CERCA|nr:unnamed protein product [Ceratitis capitata]
MDKLSENAPENTTSTVSEMSMTSIVLAALLGFIVMAIILLLRRRSLGRRDFLLTGLKNVGEYCSGRLSGRLVDIPGHYRVRDKSFNQYKRTAKGIIFVVDSATVQKEYATWLSMLHKYLALHGILADAATQSCPILILCNKQDLSTTKGAQVIKSILEKEMNIVRITRSRKLESVIEESDSKTVFLGKEGKDFEFSHLHQNVQFYECSAKENQLSNLNDWIDRML